MKSVGSNRLLIGFATALVTVSAAQSFKAEVLAKDKKMGETTVYYEVVLPNGYDPSKTYPAILALGEGSQGMDTVVSILKRNFQAEAEKRGYIVIAPAAPGGLLFFEEEVNIFPEFLKLILEDYKIEGNKFHIAGPSNGGIAAFHIAAGNPDYFASVTAFPGYMWEPTDGKLRSISKMCVFMYVGELNEHGWHDEMKKEAEFLRSIGSVASYTVEKGQPHGLQTLAGSNAGRLFEGFEQARKTCSR